MIYFASLPSGSIKIGYSADVDRRVYELRSQFRCDVEILTWIGGDRQTERETHERFADIRFPGTEQFRPTADLMDFIGLPELTHPDPDSVVPMPDMTTTRLVRLDDEMCERAKKLAALKETSMAEMFTAVLKPWVDREWAKEVKKIKDPEGGGK